MEIKVANVHTQAMFLVCPLPERSFIQVPFPGRDATWGMDHNVRSERRGTWCVFYPLSQMGEHGGTLGMMSEEESSPGRRNISRRALAVSHARDESLEARPGAELGAGDPRRSRGKHTAAWGGRMVGRVNCPRAGLFQAPVWASRVLWGVLWWDRFPPAPVIVLSPGYTRPYSLVAGGTGHQLWQQLKLLGTAMRTLASPSSFHIDILLILYPQPSTYWTCLLQRKNFLGVWGGEPEILELSGVLFCKMIIRHIVFT